MTTLVFVYGISALSIILGFIALLTQKIYIDPNTKQPTVEVEIKFLGKLKTNIAALTFVFLGIALAVFAYSKPAKKVEWTLIGQFRDEGNKIVDCRTGTIKLIPWDTSNLSNNGSFDITINIEEGKTIEDVIQIIDYSHEAGRACIDLKKAYEAYRKGEESLIQLATKNIREYKPVSIKYIPKNIEETPDE